jgi:hypothetical protein
VPASPLVESSTTSSTLRSDSAFGVDLIDSELKTDQLVLADGGVSPGQRVVDPDLHAVGGAGAQDEGAGELGRADYETRLQQMAAADRIHEAFVGHFGSLRQTGPHAVVRGPSVRCVAVFPTFSPTR